MSEDGRTDNLIPFRQRTASDQPSIIRKRKNKWLGPEKQIYCRHPQMTVDEDTELVTCVECDKVMSAFNALMIIVMEWETMKYESDEYRKAQEDQSKAIKAGQVKRFVKQLQYIELPEEEPARTYWLKLTEARDGKEPYALFKRGRGQHAQWLMVSDNCNGWQDADSLIEQHERHKASRAVEIKQSIEKEVAREATL